MTGNANRVLVLIVLVIFSFFSWNLAEFFSPDGVYYFGRRLVSFSDIWSAFGNLDNRGQYRPLGLVLFSFVLYPLFGLNATGYHVIPLLFHVSNVLLVYRIARRLRADLMVALGAAFFFALHRCNFFVTFGVTFLPDFLGCFFFLAAFLAYLKSRGPGGHILALFLWILALGNKETAVVFPALLLCYEGFLADRPAEDSHWSKVLKRVLPFAAVSLVFVGFMFYLRAGNLYPGDTSHPYRMSWSVSSLLPKIKYLWWAVNLPDGSGLGNALMPALIKSASLPKLTVPYPFLTLVSAGLMLPFAVGFTGFVIFRLAKRDRLVIFGLAAFLLTLAPVLPLAGRVMHHNLYFSLLGLSLVVGQFSRTILDACFKVLLPVLAFGFMFSTVVGVTNERHTSWPVKSARVSKQLLERFQEAAARHGVCQSGRVLIGRTGEPDFVWYSDGGNLFRVFGPCPDIEVYFEDLGQTPPDSKVVRLDLKER
ncbi:MAG: hypothetical protein ACE15E_14310 [Acidobacteriota bacterium]